MQFVSETLSDVIRELLRQIGQSYRTEVVLNDTQTHLWRNRANQSITANRNRTKKI